MKTRTLGRSGIEVSALGYGCMGLEACLWSCDRPTGRHQDHPRGVRSRHHVLRHRGGLRPVHERGTRGRSCRSVPRSGRDCDKVRVRHQPGRHALWRRQSSRTRSSGCGRHAHAVEGHDHRPAVSAPRRPERPDRGRRRHGGRADRAGQGEALRVVRGQRPDDPARTRRPARRGRSERVLVVDARRRAQRRTRHLRRTRTRLCSVQPARRGVSDGQDRHEHDLRRQRFPHHLAAVRTGRARRQHGDGPFARAPRPSRSTPRRRRSPLRGCLHSSPGSYRFPGREDSSGSTRTSVPLRWTSRMRICERSTTRHPRSPFRAPGFRSRC